jgi:hypothetical protein
LDRRFFEWVACGSCRDELARIDLANCSCVCDCASVDDLVPCPRTIGNYQTRYNETRIQDRGITKQCTVAAKPGVFKWTITCRGPMIAEVRRSNGMAVNHADGTLFASLLMYPAAAAYASIHNGGRWVTPFLVITSIGIGIAIITSARFVLYSLMERVIKSKLMANEDGWPALILGPPMMLIYLAFPIVVTSLGLFLTYAGCVWATHASAL